LFLLNYHLSKIGCAFSGRKRRWEPCNSAPDGAKKNKVLCLQTKESKQARISRDSYGNVTVNQYVLLKELGRGSYGKVKLCVNTEDNEFYATKVFRKKQLSKRRVGMVKGGALRDALNEIELMKTLRHHNIIMLFEVIDDPGEDKLFMIIEYAEGGSVQVGEMETDPIPEDKARRYFNDAVAGLEYIHSKNVIHRDIKPENLLLMKDGALKISDFGVALRLSSDENANQQLLKKTVGSPAFLPPELCAAEIPQLYGTAIDIWALGVSLFFFIFGHLPFLGDTEMQMFENIRTKEVEFPREISGLLSDLITKMLQKEPEKRFTLKDIQNHAWTKASATQTT